MYWSGFVLPIRAGQLVNTPEVLNLSVLGFAKFRWFLPAILHADAWCAVCKLTGCNSLNRRNVLGAMSYVSNLFICVYIYNVSP